MFPERGRERGEGGRGEEGREGGKEGGREGGREGRREGEREGGREGKGGRREKEEFKLFHSIIYASTHHLVVIRDGFGLLQSLEPHHVLGMEPPRQLLERLGGHVLGLRSLGNGGGRGMLLFIKPTWKRDTHAHAHAHTHTRHQQTSM